MDYIDIHSHMSMYPNRIMDGDPDEGQQFDEVAGAAAWLQTMDEVGIARTITFDPDNAKTARFIDEHPGRFHGLVSVDPRVTTEAVAALDRYLDGRRFVGVKCSPSADFSHDGKGYALNDRAAWDFYEICQERRAPILFHTGIIFRDPQRPWSNSVANGRPLLLDDVARAFPDLTIVMGHCGRPLWEEALCLANLPNVHVDLAWSQLPVALYGRSIEVALRGFGAGRVMFGSDTTRAIPRRCKVLLAETRRLLAEHGVSEEDTDAVLGGTARSVFGLGHGAR